ncbi:MAG TPA: LCP family protein [Candidatus Limnocylindria bacterium]|nr:LCP family protein [Candidatus Limnocylindria bacterium]
MIDARSQAAPRADAGPAVARPAIMRTPDAGAALAALLSFIFPGLGQAYNGQARLAWLLATPVLLLAVGAALALTVARANLLSQALHISFLVGLIVLDLALLGWRLVAITQAHAGRERVSPRRWTAWTTALLLLATFAMHALPAWYAVKAIDTLSTVSQGGGVTRGGGGISRIPELDDLPPPSDQPEVERGERVNVLLVGVDSAPGRTHRLTDTMLVVSLDPNSGRSAMVSVPRDLYGVPLGDGRIFNAKLNSMMSFAEARPAEFPLGGVGTLKAALGELLGVEIHYFAAIDLLGFSSAIDAVGGVDITVERAISDPTYVDESGNRTGFYLDPGRYHFDGHDALAYVRSRMGVGDNDFTRADRQQQLLAAVREKLTAGNLVLALPSLLDAVKSSLSTDIPSARLPDLAQAVQEADMSQLRRIVLQPPVHMTADPGSAAGYILIPNLEAIRQVGQEMLSSPPPEASGGPS